MTIADWALTISLCSLAISLGSFVWNVWPKFIFPKPKVQVSFSFSAIIQGGAKIGNVLSLTATNFGPGPVILDAAVLRPKRWSPYKDYALLNPLHDYPARDNHSIGPTGGGFPKKLEPLR